MDAATECIILVDNSNVWIEGMKYAAHTKGMPNQPDGKPPQDWSWRVDFGSLLKEVQNGHRLVRAILVGSTPPPNDSVWNAAAAQGFKVITHERSSAGEKAVDTEVVAQGLKAIYKHPRPAILKLLSGDRDFVPLIQAAYEEGWETELWSFSSGMSVELAQMANRVITLETVFDKIGNSQV
ncbi:MAG: NYN domain-containing protein [Oscillospiraceae bacterium]|jgi:uncharacterized LabA/DUF88 family protein|nr:NYN domain-containing protein [Oscillospiraceae bacterium]